LRHEFEASRRESELALQLNANDPVVLIHVAWNRAAYGEPEGALELAQAALRLNPIHPEWYGWYLGRIHLLGRRPALAARHLDALREPQPRFLAWQAANCALRSEVELAKATGAAFADAGRRGWRGASSVGPEAGSWCGPLW
jgi:hypothetical protein